MQRTTRACTPTCSTCNPLRDLLCHYKAITLSAPVECTVPAKVTTITSDAVKQEANPAQQDKEGKQQAASGGAVFPATLTLAQNTIDVDGKHIRLMPGINVPAEIKTDKRRMIEDRCDPSHKVQVQWASAQAR